MLKPNFWYLLISEFVIAGLAIYFFYVVFLKPNAKSRAEEMEERRKRREDIERSNNL